jgi:hypothetical protein
VKLYHFTDPKNLPSIRKRGLVPRPLRDCPHMGKGAKAVWLMRKPGPEAGRCESGAVMLTVHIDTSDVHLGDDPDDFRPIADWCIYLGTIPPDKIVFPA